MQQVGIYKERSGNEAGEQIQQPPDIRSELFLFASHSSSRWDFPLLKSHQPITSKKRTHIKQTFTKKATEGHVTAVEMSGKKSERVAHQKNVFVRIRLKKKTTGKYNKECLKAATGEDEPACTGICNVS